MPKHVLFPVIPMMCVAGAYTINYGIMFDVLTLLILGSLMGSTVLARRKILRESLD